MSRRIHFWFCYGWSFDLLAATHIHKSGKVKLYTEARNAFAAVVWLLNADVTNCSPEFSSCPFYRHSEPSQTLLFKAVPFVSLLLASLNILKPCFKQHGITRILLHLSFGFLKVYLISQGRSWDEKSLWINDEIHHWQHNNSEQTFINYETALSCYSNITTTTQMKTNQMTTGSESVF